MADPTDRDGEEGLAVWRRNADALERDLPKLGGYPIPGLLRRARRLADLSQRQLAHRAGVAPSTVGKAESGAMTPTPTLFQRLLGAAGLHLVVVDADGRVVQPMRESDDVRNGGGRRYPSHLDTILDPRPGEWWADGYGLARPPETFTRDRRRRDEMRRRSQWELREYLGGLPAPPRPGEWEAREAARQDLAERIRAGLVATVGPEDVDEDQ